MKTYPFFQVWFSNRRARLRKQAQSCPPSAYNPMGLPMSAYPSSAAAAASAAAASSPYMESHFPASSHSSVTPQVSMSIDLR